MPGERRTHPLRIRGRTRTPYKKERVVVECQSELSSSSSLQWTLTKGCERTNERPMGQTHRGLRRRRTVRAPKSLKQLAVAAGRKYDAHGSHTGSSLIKEYLSRAGSVRCSKLSAPLRLQTCSSLDGHARGRVQTDERTKLVLARSAAVLLTFGSAGLSGSLARSKKGFRRVTRGHRIVRLTVHMERREGARRVRCLRTRGAAATSPARFLLRRSRERWCFDSGRRARARSWSVGMGRVVAVAAVRVRPSVRVRPIAKWGKWRQSRWHRRLKEEKRSNQGR